MKRVTYTSLLLTLLEAVYFWMPSIVVYIFRLIPTSSKLYQILIKAARLFFQNNLNVKLIPDIIIYSIQNWLCDYHTQT